VTARITLPAHHSGAAGSNPSKESAMNDRDSKKSKDIVVTTTSVAGDANRDAITGAPGSHPVATGVGALGGAAAGAAVGTVAGPVGTVVGGVVGAVAGGLAGKGVGEAIDPTAEETYWRTTYTTVPYFAKNSGFDFNDYGPAYRYGWESQTRNVGRKFDDVEKDLAREWNAAKGASRLGWSEAKSAAQASWQRVSNAVERLTPGDSDHDGK
jgi:hypothetical protein